MTRVGRAPWLCQDQTTNKVGSLSRFADGSEERFRRAYDRGLSRKAYDFRSR